MSRLVALAVALTCVGIAACGGPASTETTTTSRVEHPASGGEVRTSSTETTEVGTDGASTTDRTETTRTSTPPPK